MAKLNSVTDLENVKMVVVEEKKWDVAMAYALLGDGDLPPVIRGEGLEDF